MQEVGSFIHFDLLSWRKRGDLYRKLYLRVIQQLRWPTFTQFWPPTHLEWTIVNILHTYVLIFVKVTKLGLSTNYLSTQLLFSS